jgi:hypothetical protein
MPVAIVYRMPELGNYEAATLVASLPSLDSTKLRR